jgi:hypothetical protein
MLKIRLKTIKICSRDFVLKLILQVCDNDFGVIAVTPQGAAIFEFAHRMRYLELGTESHCAKQDIKIGLRSSNNSESSAGSVDSRYNFPIFDRLPTHIQVKANIITSALID